MNLRQSLKKDFGIEVLVEGGNGLRDDPFVIEPCSAMDATRAQLNLLRGLGRGRRELWRLLQVESVAPAVQRLRIQTVLFTRDQIINETRGYYFDVRRVDGMPDAGTALIEWVDSRTTFSAIYQIGWLHFDRAINNSRDGAALDTSLFYSGIGAKATIYVYGQTTQELPLAEARAKELQSVCSQVQAVHANAESPWPIWLIEPFALQHFLVGADMSVVGVAVLGRQCLKLRLTYLDDPKMRELMSDTVRELARLALKSKPAHDWAFVNEFGESKCFVDESSIEKRGEIARVLVKYSLVPPGTNKRNNQEVAAMLNIEEYDLRAGAFRVQQIVFEYTDGTESTPLISDQAWQPAGGDNQHTLMFLRKLN